MALFRSEQRSLFGEILDWMLTPLLLLWPVSLALTWLVAQNLANKPFDRALEYNAHALAQLVEVQGGKTYFNLPQPASELLRADESNAVHYQVIAPSGQFLAGESELPPPPKVADRTTGVVQLRDAELRGVEVRIAWVWVSLSLPEPNMALIQVAETREKRSVLATEIIKGVMLPQFVILPLAVLLVWLALARGIKPLHQLEERIRARKPDDLSPINHKDVPLEVVPLVDSVNGLLERLNDSLATQKRFLADAAHQLKTPLAGLRMQAEMALRTDAQTDDLKLSLQQIGRSSIRATHTVNQLLSLARAESPGALQQRAPCNMADIVLDALHDCLDRALAKHIDIGHHGTPFIAVSTMVCGPSSGAMSRATSARAGALTATTTRSCTPSAAALSAACTGTCSSPSACCSRRPWVCKAASVAPRATTLTGSPMAAKRAPIQPPMAPAP